MLIKYFLFIQLFIATGNIIFSQSLLDDLNNENSKKNDTLFANAIFKSTRMINGQNVETVGKNEFNLTISHRFGNLNSGVHQFYGLDQSYIRLGIEYGITGRLDVGIGRSREQELVDGYIKVKLLRQASGAYFMPVSVSLYSSLAVRMDKWTKPEINYNNYHRLNYINELLIARKFSDRISMQIVPGLVHRNITETRDDKNLVPYIGFGGRCKISKHFTISTEYYWVYPDITKKKIHDPLSVGIEIETGGHVFQLHFSNSRGMNEKLIPENLNNWQKGDFGFGFNIIRHFNFKRNKI